jgi:tetratricopeptide (TPR) repeat protein
MIASTFQALIVPSAAHPSSVLSANTLNDHAVQFWQVGRRSEAMTDFTAAARADPEFAVPWHNQGTIYLIEGQFAQAIPNLVRAAQLAPEWTLPRVHLAQAYLRSGDATSALAVSDAVRAIDPTLPDVRAELRTLLLARVQIATALANRRRNYFTITLVVAVLITLLTAGIFFATLAVPIYRFTLYSQASRARAVALEQLRLLDSAPAVPTPAAPSRPAAVPWSPVSASGAYVSAGALPPYSAAELEGSPSDDHFRRAGWRLLLGSVVALSAGAAALLATNTSLPSPAQANVGQILEGGALALFGLGALFVTFVLLAIALIVGAVAAFRRHRMGWVIGISVVGGLGIFLLVPAMLMVVFYLVAMPRTSANRRLEFVPMPQVTLGQPPR